jgi:hypothetical protein
MFRGREEYQLPAIKTYIVRLLCLQQGTELTITLEQIKEGECDATFSEMTKEETTEDFLFPHTDYVTLSSDAFHPTISVTLCCVGK